MTRYARIDDGKVVAIETFELPDGIIVGQDIFVGIELVPTPNEEIAAGWGYEDGTFLAPPPPAEPTLAELLAYAAGRRWQVEAGGITIAGVPIATDDRSKIMIMGARVAATSNANWETVWHGADGSTYPLNAPAMIAISNAVEAHVNATFALFAIVKADIEAGQITTLAEIDAMFYG